MDTLYRSAIYGILDSGEPFDIEFVTADRKRGTGGKLMAYKSWVKVRKPPVNQAGAGADLPHEQPDTRFPDHLKHGTVNIKNPGNKHAKIIKVHIALILTLNGKRIING